MGSPRRPRAVLKVATFGLSAVLGLTLIEGVIRFLGRAAPLPEEYRDFIRDPYLPFIPKPNRVRRGTSRSGEFQFEFRHNSQGLRDEEHSVHKPDNVFRILALGDSFTWGVGASYEETYLYLLERRLNRRGPAHKSVEIIKAGAPRFFPKIERLQLEHYGIRYAPDLVLVAFTFSDVQDTARGLDTLRPTSKDGYLITRRAARLGSLGTWLYINSHAARTALSAYLSRTEATPSRALRHRHTTDQERETAWTKIEAEYDRMYAIADRNGASFVVVNIPRLDLDTRPSKRLASMIAKRPYEFIDVLSDMRAAQERNSGALYWAIDHHCTPEGYAVIADTLFRELTARELVP